MSETVINANNISKRFKVYSNPWHRAVEWGSFGRVKKHEDFWALKDISFQVEKGECLGIIGANGAGKSTLLKILTGTLSPTSGQFNIRGNVLSLLELGTGFNMELTGRQNLFNSARLLGFPDSYIAGRIREIEEFSELGDFFDRPIKMYSSGMYVRLAFSMFVNMEPQILIIDEALSVGDVFFQQKSFAKMREIIKSGTTCIFVSHDLSAVQNLCDWAILLNQGEIGFSGEPEEAVSRYFAGLSKRPSVKAVSNNAIPNVEMHIDPNDILAHDILGNNKNNRYGAGGMEILALRVTDKKGKDTLQVEMMDTLTFNLLIKANEEIPDPSTGIRLFDRMGNRIYTAGTRQLKYQLPPLLPGEQIVVRFDLTMSVQPGEYTFGVGVSEPSEEGPNVGFAHDRIDMMGPITVIFDHDEVFPFYGIAKLPMEVCHYKTKTGKE